MYTNAYPATLENTVTHEDILSMNPTDVRPVTQLSNSAGIPSTAVIAYTARPCIYVTLALLNAFARSITTSAITAAATATRRISRSMFLNIEPAGYGLVLVYEL